jgi:hypothetical protein
MDKLKDEPEKEKTTTKISIHTRDLDEMIRTDLST